jgi:hypothetical protein
MQPHGFAQGLVIAEGQRHSHGVAAVLQFGENPLRQAVERACDKQDVHRMAPG